MISRLILRLCCAFIFLSIAQIAISEVPPDTHGNASKSDPNSISDLQSFIGRLNNVESFSKNRAQCASGATFRNGKRVGRMSTGYFYGMMLTFANAVCRVKEGQNGDLYSAILTSPAGSMSRKDTFVHNGYKESLQGDPLVQNYSLLLSLGMLESSGMFNEGIDRSASNTDGITTEAGLFQVSFNSVNSSQVPHRIYDELMTKYSRGQDTKACMTTLFSMDQRLSKNTRSFGSGAALEFQNAMKSCPAMAAEYMSILLRRDVNHNGPLKREEAQPSPECSAALTAVKGVAESNCKNISSIANNLPEAKLARFEVAPDRPINRDYARKRGGSTLSQMEDELDQLRAEQLSATSDAEKAAIGERIKAAELSYADAQKNPDLLKEREGIEQANNEALKNDQIQNEQKLEELSKEDGYMERSPQEVKKLGEEADALDKKAVEAEKLAQEEQKKPRQERNKEVIAAAQQARGEAGAKQAEYVKAKQIQELQQKVKDGESKLQGAAIESMKKAEAQSAASTKAVEDKKTELAAAQKEREAKGEVIPSAKEEQLATELKALEAKNKESAVVLTSEVEVRNSLEALKKEFSVAPYNNENKALAAEMVSKINENIKAIDALIAGIDPKSTVLGDSDKLVLLMQLKRKLRAELKLYEAELSPK